MRSTHRARAFRCAAATTLQLPTQRPRHRRIDVVTTVRSLTWIGYGQGAHAEFQIRSLTDGERITLGEVTLEIMHTPGHTAESISVLVYEHPVDDIAYGVLTGDAVFIGDVGRPDLEGDSPDDLHGDDRGGDPVDGHAERGHHGVLAT